MSIKKGVKGALPIMLGYVPVGIAFGIISADGDIPLYVVVMLSAIVFAGASQFMASYALTNHLAYPQIIIATFIMNFRHIIMSMSIASRLHKDSHAYKPIMAFFVTDESYAVTSFEDELHHKYVLPLQIAAYLTWNGATVVGFMIGNFLPSIVQKSMGITLYILFLTLLVPEVKKGKEALIVSGLSAIINSVSSLFLNIDPGWSLVLSLLVASAIALMIFGEEEVAT